MKLIKALFSIVFASISVAADAEFFTQKNLKESVNFKTVWENGTIEAESIKTAKDSYAWLTFKTDENHDFSSAKYLCATVENLTDKPQKILLYAVGKNGWSAACGMKPVPPNQSEEIRCDLRKTFPDGTPRIDPTKVNKIQLIIPQNNSAEVSKIRVSNFHTQGKTTPWIRPQNRLSVPNVINAAPSAGKRVRFQLENDKANEIYCALYLTNDWEKGAKKYPVIVEYPGNIFYTEHCYSTGLPDQCAIGYGMSEGSAIWLSMPFIDRKKGSVVSSGFGNPDETAKYVQDVLKTVFSEFNGDSENVIFTGFSRGSIACGFIGLRNPEIGKIWKAIHGCQHYDGSKWRESNIAGAVERAKNFKGVAIFQTDNDQKKYQPVVNATDPKVKWSWEKSGLKAHDTAMFLDDRESTQKLRNWYRDIIRN